MSDAIEAVLLPCPFCGGAAEWYDITEDDEVGNAGGSCITCTKCQACGPVQFGEKDTIVEQWNRRPAITAYEAAKGTPTPRGASMSDAIEAAVVRDLEWQAYGGRWRAFTPIAVLKYIINCDAGGRFYVAVNGQPLTGRYNSSAEAKTAGQSHFEAAIRSALKRPS